MTPALAVDGEIRLVGLCSFGDRTEKALGVKAMWIKRALTAVLLLFIGASVIATVVRTLREPAESRAVAEASDPTAASGRASDVAATKPSSNPPRNRLLLPPQSPLRPVRHDRILRPRSDCPGVCQGTRKAARSNGGCSITRNGKTRRWQGVTKVIAPTVVLVRQERRPSGPVGESCRRLDLGRRQTGFFCSTFGRICTVF